MTHLDTIKYMSLHIKFTLFIVQTDKQVIVTRLHILCSLTCLNGLAVKRISLFPSLIVFTVENQIKFLTGSLQSRPAQHDTLSGATATGEILNILNGMLGFMQNNINNLLSCRMTVTVSGK